MKLPMTRARALELIKKYNSEKTNLNHYLESEAVMRELALHFGLNADEVDYWGVLGLLHDIDWEMTKDNVPTHLTRAPGLLKDAGFDDDFIEIVLSHGYGFEELPHLAARKRTERIHHALAGSETITGLIHSYALMRGSRVSDMDAKGLMKKFKDKAFAAKVSREIISECEKLGLTLEEFFAIAIRGISKIKEHVGLS